MKVELSKEIIHSNKKGDFFVIRYVLLDENNKVISKSSPIFWIDEQTYNSANINCY